jgi:uncharacterized protein YmfQ (DUF2313 family)
MALTSDDYKRQLQALLPRGAAWTREPGSVLAELLGAWGDEYARIDARADVLREEADPRTANQLLTDWERVAGLPDPCIVSEQTTPQRRFALLAKLTNAGGQSKAYFIALLLGLGFVVTIDEFLEHTVDDDNDHQLYGADWAYAWQINAPLVSYFELSVDDTAGDPLAYWSNEQLECVVNRLKPAHTIPIFAYT